jgi:hypothetical protein
MSHSPHGRTLLNLDRVATWPTDLLAFLHRHHDLFLNWEERPERCDPGAYDEAIYALQDSLQPFAITGWHCSRLTETEISDLLVNGLPLPSAARLHRRIDAAVAARMLPANIAVLLKSRHQAADSNRAGMLWFCLFPPRLAREGGINRFFRHWGGEALCSSHEHDPVTSPALRAMGTPTLIEADVPIDVLHDHGGLPFKIVRRYLISQRFKTHEPVEHEDRIKGPLPAPYVRRVIRFPEEEFIALTECASWKPPLT